MRNHWTLRNTCAVVYWMTIRLLTVYQWVSDIWFPALRCRSRTRSRSRFRSRFRNRFRKNRVRTCRSVCRCWGVCAARARQAQGAGRRVSRAKEWAELQASWYVRNSRYRYGKIELDPIWTDQRTETDNVIFLRKLRSSYGIRTDERNSYVLLQRTTATRERRNGYVTLETTHEWHPSLRKRKTSESYSYQWGHCIYVFYFYVFIGSHFTCLFRIVSAVLIVFLICYNLVYATKL